MTKNNQLHERRIKVLREAFDAGMSLRGASAHCGIAKATVERYWRRWKSEDWGGEMVCKVKGETKRRWKQEADEREMSVHALLAFIVETIAEENLFKAVME
jgi:transposase